MKVEACLFVYRRPMLQFKDRGLLKMWKRVLDTVLPLLDKYLKSFIIGFVGVIYYIKTHQLLQNKWRIYSKFNPMFFPFKGCGDVSKRRPTLGVWRRICESQRNAVLSLQRSLVLPFQFETMGEDTVSRTRSVDKFSNEQNILIWGLHIVLIYPLIPFIVGRFLHSKVHHGTLEGIEASIMQFHFALSELPAAPHLAPVTE